MGFSLIASAAILAVTLFMAVEIISGSLLPTLEGINTSYGELKDRLQNQIQTDIKISNVSRSFTGSNYDYNITVQNTGSVTLATEKFIVLFNGTTHPATCSRTYLYPDETVYFSVVNVSGNGPTRIKIITNNGIADYYTYNPG
jgi:archaellum component FlaF (FlaF/FlaG flagellin family)